MKKMLSAMISVILLAMIFLPVSAESTTYNLKKLGIKIKIPSEYVVFTRKLKDDDPYLNKLGVKKDEILSYLKSNKIYLDGISKENKQEIVVTMIDNYSDDFSTLNDYNLKIFADSIKERYKSVGYSLTDYSIYQNSQAKFVEVRFRNSEKTVYGLQYYTVYDNKAINITLRSYEGKIGSSKTKDFRKIIDTVTFTNKEPETEAAEKTDAFIYEDANVGIKFTVPANWSEKELSKPRNYIDVKFASNENTGVFIMYGCTDIWEILPDSEKTDSSRSDIDLSFFTKEEIAELANLDEENIKFCTHNGVTYYSIFLTDEEITQLVTINDGRLYLFQFTGKADNKHYNDFIALVDSVEYSALTSTENNAVSDNNETNNNETNNNEANNILNIIVLTIIIVTVIVLIVIYIIKNKKSDDILYKSLYDNIDFSEYDTDINCYCRNCGQELISGSDFCHQCGTKIIK